MKTNIILQGDVIEKLKELPDESVNCIITSPPYWGLRDYGTATWEGGSPDCDHTIPEYEKDPKYPQGTSHNIRFIRDKCYKCGAKRIDLQLGLEPTLKEYIDKMLLVTAELKRVLRKGGVLFWNHGDNYNSSPPGNKEGQMEKQLKDGDGVYGRLIKRYGGDGAKFKNEDKSIPTKCLCFQNYRLIINMVDKQGWILRNTIIWHKPNHMPSSVKDRFANSYEPVFMLVKNKKYWFDLDAVRQKHKYLEIEKRRKDFAEKVHYGGQEVELRGKNRFGRSRLDDFNPSGKNPGDVWKIATQPFSEAHFATFPEKLIEPMIKAGCPEEGVVLDPFFGSGTTGLVALKLNRKFIGIELNEEYIKIAKKRIGGWKEQSRLNEYTNPHPKTPL